MNPVTTADITDRWKVMNDAETRRAEAKLADAWAELKRRVPNFVFRVDSGDIDPDLLRKIICDAVEGSMRNPEGFVEMSVDDFRARRSESATKSRNLFTDEDLALLAPDEDDSQAFSIVLEWS